MAHMQSTIDLHRRIRQEGHKIYLNLTVEPFDFDYYDVEREIFYKQGDFFGNHYMYHSLRKGLIRPDEPLDWVINSTYSGKIPVLKFNKDDCDFGKDPALKPVIQHNQIDEDEKLKNWILNHPKLSEYTDMYIEYIYLEWCYSATLFSNTNAKFGVASGNNQSEALNALYEQIKRKHGEYN